MEGRAPSRPYAASELNFDEYESFKLKFSAQLEVLCEFKILIPHNISRLTEYLPFTNSPSTGVETVNPFF